jgi:hypothetical protein
MRTGRERSNANTAEKSGARIDRSVPARWHTTLPLLAATALGASAIWLASTRGSVEREPAAPAVSAAEAHPSAETLSAPVDTAPPERTLSRARRTTAVELASGTRDPRSPRTESEYLAELRTLSDEDPAAFELRVGAVLSGDGPECEQFAALRVVYEAQRPGAAHQLARAIVSLPKTSGPQGESVPRALVQWLARRAPLEVHAREALDEIVWGDALVDPELRSLAVRERILTAPAEDVAVLVQRVHAERDSLVQSAGLACLAERDAPLSQLDRRQEFP